MDSSWIEVCMSNLLNTYAKFVLVTYVLLLIHQDSRLTASIKRQAGKQGPVGLISQLWQVYRFSQMEQNPDLCVDR